MPAPAIEVHARKGQPLGMPPARFLRDYWQKRPLLIHQAFADFTPPLQPDDLAGLACMAGALARIITRTNRSHSSLRGHAKRGARNDEQWKVRIGPFDDDTFATLPESRWTLLVQDVDKWNADTAALLDAFAFIPNWRIDDVMISYATDNGGVGAHVDQYDVFLLQGLGRRRWTIDTGANPPTTFRDDVELKLLRQFRPTHEWTLDPGDMLYLPPGVPHNGVAVGECMTFSLGMRAPAASELLLDFAHHLAETLPESQRYADPDLVPDVTPGEIDDAALRRARHTLGPTATSLDDNAFADWFGSFVTRYRCSQAAAPRKRATNHAALAKRLPKSILQRDPWSRFAWRRKGRDARLYVSGAMLDASIAWAKALASGVRTLDGAKLAKLPRQACGIALLAALIDAGHFTCRHR